MSLDIGYRNSDEKLIAGQEICILQKKFNVFNPQKKNTYIGDMTRVFFKLINLQKF